MNGWVENDKTPEGRIALVAWQHVAKNERNGCRTHLPDLRDDLAPYVQLEIETKVLEAVQKHGAYREALEIITRIEDLQKVIAARKA